MSQLRHGRGSPVAFLTDLSILGNFDRGNSFALARLVCPPEAGKPLAWLACLGGILSGLLEKGGRHDLGKKLPGAFVLPSGEKGFGIEKNLFIHRHNAFVIFQQP
jgi:hypothetical protein